MFFSYSRVPLGTLEVKDYDKGLLRLAGKITVNSRLDQVMIETFS